MNETNKEIEEGFSFDKLEPFLPILIKEIKELLSRKYVEFGAVGLSSDRFFINFSGIEGHYRDLEEYYNYYPNGHEQSEKPKDYYYYLNFWINDQKELEVSSDLLERDGIILAVENFEKNKSYGNLNDYAIFNFNGDRIYIKKEIIYHFEGQSK